MYRQTVHFCLLAQSKLQAEIQQMLIWWQDGVEGGSKLQPAQLLSFQRLKFICVTQVSLQKSHDLWSPNKDTQVQSFQIFLT